MLLKIKQLVKPYVNDHEALENLNDKTDFIKDLKINSANLIDIILDVEVEFGIVIDNDSMEKMLDVQSAISVVETKLKEKK